MSAFDHEYLEVVIEIGQTWSNIRIEHDLVTSDTYGQPGHILHSLHHTR